MYGVTWEQASAKYHISFMIANDTPGSQYGTAECFKEASMACGYHFALTGLYANDSQTAACVTNGHDVTIESDFILPTQAIQFDADFR